MARVLVLLLIWLLQAGLIVLLVDADWMQRQASSERSSIEQQLGQTRYLQLEASARATYNAWFTVTGIRDQSYARLLPDPTVPKDGMEGLAPWFFKWLKERLDAFWAILFQAICRVHLIKEWSAVLLATACVAVADGVVQRRIKRFNHGLASADKYLAARYALLAVFFLPLIYLTAPIAITPFFVPVWGAFLSLICMLLAAHAQHRI